MSTMTQKHYIFIAKALREARPDIPDRDLYEAWGQCVKHFAIAARRDNRAFSYSRFYKACGYDRDLYTGDATHTAERLMLLVAGE